MKLERVGMPRWAVNRTKEATGKHGRSERSACRTLHTRVNTPRHTKTQTVQHTAYCTLTREYSSTLNRTVCLFFLQNWIIFLWRNFGYPYALTAEIFITYFHTLQAHNSPSIDISLLWPEPNGDTIASRFAVKGSGFPNSGCIFGVWHFHFQVSYVREVNSFHFFSSVPCVWKHWNILKGGHRALC